jgi:hypothetical protein
VKDPLQCSKISAASFSVSDIPLAANAAVACSLVSATAVVEKKIDKNAAKSMLDIFISILLIKKGAQICAIQVCRRVRLRTTVFFAGI